MKLSRPKCLLFALILVSSGCGTQLGNGDHGKKVEESQPITADVESLEKIDPTDLPAPAALSCSIVATADEKSTDLGCSLLDQKAGTIPDTVYSYTGIAPESSVEAVNGGDHSFGVLYRVKAKDKQTSLAAALSLTINAKHGDLSVTAAVKDVLASEWTVDSSSVTGAGNCKGESCVVINLSTQLYWVRATNGQHPYAEAKAHCTNLSYGGYSDWRLPSSTELTIALAKGMAEVPFVSDRFNSNSNVPLIFWTVDSGESNAQAVLWDKANKSSNVEAHALSEGLSVLCVRG